MSHLLRPGLRVLLIGLACPAVAAQDGLPFPLEPTRVDAVAAAVGVEAFELVPRPGSLDDLAGRRSVRLVATPLPGGRLVDLDLERIDFDFGRVGVHVDGVPTGSWDPLDLSLWQGTVVGAASSEVLLAFSSHGSYGWIRHGGDLVHLMPFAGEGGDWSRARARMVSEQDLLSLGPRRRDFCLVDDIAQPFAGPVRGGEPPGDMGLTLECPMAVETDWQLFQTWGNLQATQTYTLALLAAKSARYEQQVNVVLTYPYVMFYSNPNDPWTTQETGGNAVDLLQEFAAAWGGNIPAGGLLAHFLSGAGLGGGVAWLGVLCNPYSGFAVSGNINGGVNFPVQQGSGNWDFMVTAHETGHNFGSPHTFNYSPPIDNCPNPCISNGTLMSYCHLCPGGTANITTFFHPIVVDVLRTAAENSCLPPLGCSDDGLEPNDLCSAAAPIDPGLVQGLKAVVDDTDYFKIILGPGASFSVDVLFAHADGDIDARLWGAGCVTLLDESTSTSDDEHLSAINPGPGLALFVIEVFLAGGSNCNGYELDVALTGPGPCAFPPDPFEDNDDCGSAAPLPHATYAGLEVSKTDADYYSIEVQAGSTLEVAASFEHAVGNVDLRLYADAAACAAGVPLAISTGATDLEALSWTNAGATPAEVLLGVTVFPLGYGDCNLYDLAVDQTPAGTIGSPLCDPSVPNSSGFPARLAATGSQITSQDDVHLWAARLPAGQFGYFLASRSPGLIPAPGGSQGNLCLSGNIARFRSQTQNSGAAGAFDISVALGSIPTNPPQAVLAGQTWYFQAWFRDLNPASTSNFTHATGVSFF